MIRAVLFDIDNTLVDFMKLKESCIRPAIRAMIKKGLSIDEEEGVRMVYDIYKVYGMEYKLIFQKVLKRVGVSDYKILAAGILAYRKARVVRPYPGVKRTLRALHKRGIKLAIVSDAPKLKAYLRLSAMGIDDFFDVIVTFDDTNLRKPERLPFEKALKALKVRPEEALMVGDMPGRDIVGAKRLGMIPVFALYGNDKVRPGRSGAHFEIRKIDDLLKIIEEYDV